MPNHIQNRIKITGSEELVKQVVDSLKGKYEDGTNRSVDFNTIKPMPKSLNLESGSEGDLAHNLLFGWSKAKYFPISTEEYQKRFREMSPEQRRRCVDLGLQYQENLENHGHTTWYNWSTANWGTKWNAYQNPDSRDTSDTLHFQTAWSSPVELIKQLSAKFPDVEIHLDYADEDSGCNTGQLLFKSGSTLSANMPENGSREGYDLYFELHPDRKEDYVLVGDTYVWKDND
jgi:hypothetical protein